MSLPVRTHIHQSKEFASLEEEVYIGLCLVAQAIERPWSRFLVASEGITTGQYNILRILRGAGRDGLTAGEISVRMVSRDRDMGSMIEDLVNRNHIERLRTSSHRSLANLAITRDGLDTLDRLDEHALRMPKKLLGHLRGERLKELDMLIGSVLEGDLEFP